jgi:hypothetical protein
MGRLPVLPSSRGFGAVMSADRCGCDRFGEGGAGLLSGGGPNFGVTGRHPALTVCRRSEFVCRQGRRRLLSSSCAGSECGAATSWLGMEAIASLRHGDGAVRQTKTLTHSNCVQTSPFGLNQRLPGSLVGVAGFEPAAPASRTSGLHRYFRRITGASDNSGDAVLQAFCASACKLRSNRRGTPILWQPASITTGTRRAALACDSRAPARFRQTNERT